MDTLHKLNTDRSIKYRRLVYKWSFSLIADYIFYYCHCMVVLVILFFPVLLVRPTGNSFLIVSIDAIFIGFILWMIANMVLLNKLVKIESKGKSANRKVMENTLLKNYNRIRRVRKETTMVRYVKSYKYGTFEKLITCLYDNDVIYIGTTSRAKTEFLPVCGLYDYLKSRQIAKQFTLEKQCVTAENFNIQTN